MQRRAYIGLRTEEDVLECWKSNKDTFNAWEDIKYATREYYSNHYKLDRALNEIRDLK